MVVKSGRVLAAVVVALILVAAVRPAACEVPSLLRPISSAGKTLAATTKKVAKSSVATFKKLVAAPKKLLAKAGKKITGKKKSK